MRTLAPEPLPVPSGPPRLEKGVIQEREIRAGEVHEYRIAAQAGDYARVTVEQNGVDVAVRLVGPSDEEVAAADGAGGKKVPELLSWIAAAGGDFRLIISPHDPARAGLYKVTLEELRPAIPGDDKRIAAERATSEATHRKAQESKESRIAAIAKFEEALPLWREVGDRQQEVETLNGLGAVHWLLGETGKAVSVYDRALSLALDSGDLRGEALARNNLALAYRDLGDSKKALQLFRESLRLWEELKDSV
ncbi:MAG TPA: tetratricopeptide repeat protein, partial [Thermoanaerobaculia bacterium]|nr:tetratricopeptide repeat protein [Thermoanaerobaculia bacterium]